MGTQPTITRARLEISEYSWDRIGSSGHSFLRNGSEARTTVVVHDEAAGTCVVSGVKDMVVMNSTDSEFWGYTQDPYTSIEETRDRILATQVEAQCRFPAGQQRLAVQLAQHAAGLDPRPRLGGDRPRSARGRRALRSRG